MERIGITSDGYPVYRHPEGHSHRPDLDAEVIGRIDTKDRSFIRETVDLGRIIGVDHLVLTGDSDKIVMLRRGNRPNESRMVLNREAAPTSRVTAIICKGGPEDGELAGKYALVTLFEGEPGCPEPVGRNDTPENRAFWAHHALVPTDEELELIKNN